MEDKQMPKPVAAVISGIMKFLEKSEKDYIENKRAVKIAAKEEEYEDS